MNLPQAVIAFDVGGVTNKAVLGNGLLRIMDHILDCLAVKEVVLLVQLCFLVQNFGQYSALLECEELHMLLVGLLQLQGLLGLCQEPVHFLFLVGLLLFLQYPVGIQHYLWNLVYVDRGQFGHIVLQRIDVLQAQ